MASCPNCGFDLNDSKICPVCGHGAGETRPTAKNPSGRRITFLVGASVAVLLIAVAVYLLVSIDRGAAGPIAPAAAIGPPSSGGAPQRAAPDAAGPAAPSVAADPAGNPASSAAAGLVERSELPPIDAKSAYVKWMLAHTSESEAFLSEKWDRAQIAIGRGDVTSKRVLMAFLLTPRERFVVKGDEPRAYADAAIPIGYGQTISGPHIVIRMTNAINPKPEERVLEVGTGSGYQSAILSQLSSHVYTIEIVKPLYERTDALYLSMSNEFPMYRNIQRRNSDGYYGWPSAGPFDRIIVTAAIDHIPPELLKELTPGGIMVIPVGPPTGQTVLKITKYVDPDGSIRLAREDIYHGRSKKTFVPFTAEGGGFHSMKNDSAGGT